MLSKVSAAGQEGLWPDAGTSTTWARKPGERRFTVVSRHDRPIDPRWDADQVAAAVGGASSVDVDDDGSADRPAWFPAAFRHSPDTGRPLIAARAGAVDAWLPPSGSHHLREGLLRGGRLTDLPLSLGRAVTAAVRPAELPLPPPGQYRFLVAAHGLTTGFLLALCRDNGTIHCWLPQRRAWAEVAPTPDSVFLGAERLREEYWGLEATGLERDTVLYWPCDAGLARVRVDPLSLTYEAELLAPGCCVSQPLIVGDRLHVLVQGAPGGASSGASLVSFALADPATVRHEVDGVPDGAWTVAATPHEAIWISDVGQVVANPRRALFGFFPWQPAGIQPQRELGSPYCARDGHLWLQVMHPAASDGDEGPGYLSLGRPTFEWRPSGGLRTISGRSSVKVEQRLTDDPWEEPTVVSSDSRHNNEAVMPLLESTADRALLVLRVDHADSIKKFFRLGEPLLTRFQIFGEQPDEVGFFSVKLRRPWNASAFVFDGALHLYHPELPYIPWWPLAARGSKPGRTSGAGG